MRSRIALQPAVQTVIADPAAARSRSVFSTTNVLPLPVWAQAVELIVSALFGRLSQFSQ